MALANLCPVQTYSPFLKEIGVNKVPIDLLMSLSAGKDLQIASSGTCARIANNF
jgi:hypothetical protein